ncbi:hypothetical protein [Streptomyces sp. YKOK-I1]
MNRFALLPAGIAAPASFLATTWIMSSGDPDWVPAETDARWALLIALATVVSGAVTTIVGYAFPPNADPPQTGPASAFTPPGPRVQQDVQVDANSSGSVTQIGGHAAKASRPAPRSVRQAVTLRGSAQVRQVAGDDSRRRRG